MIIVKTLAECIHALRQAAVTYGVGPADITITLPKSQHRSIHHIAAGGAYCSRHWEPEFQLYGVNFVAKPDPVNTVTCSHWGLFERK